MASKSSTPSDTFLSVLSISAAVLISGIYAKPILQTCFVTFLRPFCRMGEEDGWARDSGVDRGSVGLCQALMTFVWSESFWTTRQKSPEPAAHQPHRRCNL